MTLAPGTTVGRYQIVEPLGQGGMATVYKAYQPALERTVALKVIRRGFAEDPEFRERFAREAKAIARLTHPHIVQVFDYDEADGQLFLAMQYLEGGTLKARLAALAERGAVMDDDEALRILRQVSDALEYAHRRDVVHRDIKPANVMLTEDGSAVVTDFGIAKIIGGTSHTQTGVGIGTPEYMSPEQGQALPLDGRADLYSLAVMAFEMLTGALPYQADTPLAVVLKHLRDPLPLPSSLRPDLGPAVDHVLLRGLAKDPADRHATTTELVDALGPALRERPGPTLPTVVTSRRDRSSATVRAPVPAVRAPAFPAALVRSPTALALGALALLLLGGGGAAVLGAFVAPTPTPRADVAVSTTVPSSTPPTFASPTRTATAAPSPTATTARTATASPVVVTTPPPSAGPCAATGDPARTGVEGVIRYVSDPIPGIPVEIWVENVRRGSATTGADGRYRVVGIPVSGLVSVFPQLDGTDYAGVHEPARMSVTRNTVTRTCGGAITTVPDLLLVWDMAQAIAPIEMFGTTSPGSKTIRWSHIPGATSYRVHLEASDEYRNSCTIGFRSADTPVAFTSYVTPDLIAGRYYGFVIRAFAGTEITGEGDVCFGVQ